MEVKLVISDTSIVGGGQVFKLEAKDNNHEGLASLLTEMLKIDLKKHKLCYIDSELENIQILDQHDWSTCLEEYRCLTEEKQKKGIVLVIEKLKEDPNSTKPSPVATPQQTAITPVQQTSNEPATTPVPITAETPAAPKEQAQAQPLPVVAEKKEAPATPSQQAVQTPQPTYRFRYSKEELEVVKQVSPHLFTKLEQIFADKVEHNLIEGERSFKVYHEQQLKHKMIENSKRIQDLTHAYERKLSEVSASPALSFKNAQITPSPLASPLVFQVVDSVKKPEETTQGQASKYVHLDVTCDGCGAFPMRGLRYKSVTQRDYDLCEKCFLSNKDTKEAFLCLRESEPKNTNNLVTMARAVELPNYEQSMKHLKRYHQWADSFKDFQVSASEDLDKILRKFSN